MTSTFLRRPQTLGAALALALTSSLLAAGPVQAYWPLHHKQQAVLMAPVAQAQAPVVYAQAPTTYAQAPTTYAQAPTTYAQAPTTYAQAPVNYVTTTAAAPYSAATGSAPTVGGAPSLGGAPVGEGNRVSEAIRNAVYADLVAFYHSEESGTTRLEKIGALRDRAREAYDTVLADEDDPELTTTERNDMRLLVDWVISGGPGAAERTYYPPLAPPPANHGQSVGNYGQSAGNYGYSGGNYGVGQAGPTILLASPPPTLLVPVVAYPYKHHHLFHK